MVSAALCACTGAKLARNGRGRGDTLKQYIIGITVALALFGGGVALGTQLDFGNSPEPRTASTPANEQPPEEELAPEPTTPPEDASDKVKNIGEEWSIEGEYDAGGGTKFLELDVTPTEVDDPARTDTSPKDLDEPDSRWVRFKVRMENLGDDSYDLDGTGSFALIDSDGQEIVGNDVTPVGPGEQLSGTLLAGDTRTGTVLFLVPKDAEPDELRLSPVSGDPESIFRWDAKS